MFVMIHASAINDGSIFLVKVTHLIKRVYSIELDQFSTAA